jgi:DNA-binding MarR family transcriptional regulator
MTPAEARETARELLEIMPLVMRTVAAELRSAGELPAPAHFPLLMMLREQPRSLSELAAFRGVSLPTMSNSIAALVHRGWARRLAGSGALHPPSEALPAPSRNGRGLSARANGHDRRIVLIEVTPAGRALLERVGRRAEAHLADVLAPLDRSSRRKLENGLGVLRRIFAAPPASATRRRHDRARD